MVKYPLTAEGIEALTDTLHRLGDKELQDEAVLLAEDMKGWIAARLELQVHELEYLRGIGERYAKMMGWSLAAALLSRRIVTFACILGDDDAAANPENACMLYSLRLAGHYDGQRINCTGDMHITVYGNAVKDTF